MELAAGADSDAWRDVRDDEKAAEMTIIERDRSAVNNHQASVCVCVCQLRVSVNFLSSSSSSSVFLISAVADAQKRPCCCHGCVKLFSAGQPL